MVQMNENIVGLDASILMHPTTWKHLDTLMPLMTLIDNKDSKEDTEQMF
jgi:glycyl-tRNA synthetase